MYEDFSNNPYVDYGSFVPESDPLDPVAEMEKISRGATPTPTSCVDAVAEYYASENIERNRRDNFSTLGEEYASEAMVCDRKYQQPKAVKLSPLAGLEYSDNITVSAVSDIIQSDDSKFDGFLMDRSQAGVLTPPFLALPEDHFLNRLTQKELKRFYNILRKDLDSVKIHTGNGWIENMGKEKLDKDLGCFGVEGEVKGFSHNYPFYGTMDFTVVFGHVESNVIAVIKLVDSNDNDYYYVPDFFIYRGYYMKKSGKVAVNNIMYCAAQNYLSCNNAIESPDSVASDTVYKMMIAMLMCGSTSKTIKGDTE